jgi:hypothetical protein
MVNTLDDPNEEYKRASTDEEYGKKKKYFEKMFVLLTLSNEGWNGSHPPLP